MIQLANGCFRSELQVTPQNWKSERAPMGKMWRIWYRYYDPAHRDQWGRMFRINISVKITDRDARREVTRALIETEEHRLDCKGWNPITGHYMVGSAAAGSLASALDWALGTVVMAEDTRKDVVGIVGHVKAAAMDLYDGGFGRTYADMDISMISRRHVKDILARVGEKNKRFSADRYNKYKAYLSTLFREMLEAEMIDSNPCRDISNRKVVVKRTDVLTEEEAGAINRHLYERHYNFWRYIQLFFHSGARTTELLQLRREDVDLMRQEFKVTVLKGRSQREDTRVISDEVAALWRELVAEAKPGEYLFSRDLKPGAERIRKDQPGRRWAKYVMGKPAKPGSKGIGGLGINKRFYSLKHLHTDKVAAALGIAAAQASAGHTTPVVTLQVYAVGEKQRQRDALKKLPVKLG